MYTIKKGDVLHNSYSLPNPIRFNKVEYKSVEHLFHVLKFTYENSRAKEQRFCYYLLKEDDPLKVVEMSDNSSLKGYIKHPFWDQVERAAMTFAIYAKALSNSEVIQAFIDSGNSDFRYEDDNMTWGIGVNGCGANLMSLILDEVRTFLTKNMDAEGDFIDKTLNLQWARYCTVEKAAYKRSEGNDYRIRSESRKQRFINADKNTANVIKVILTGMNPDECLHKKQQYNRFKPEIDYSAAPRIEYAKCQECGMGCLIERKEWLLE